MEAHRKSHTDRSRVTDEVTPVGAVTLTDRVAGFDGSIDVVRFTPPSAAERNDIAQSMSRSEVMERLVDLRAMNRHGRVPLLRRRHRLAEALLWAPEYEVERVHNHNLITQVGDQYYGDRAAGIAGAPGQVTGMKLGTGSTAASKTGAGAALVTYKSGSDKAIDATWPQSSLVGGARQEQWKTSWGIGVINGAALSEAVIVNDVLADATSTAANTISRSLFGPMTLGANDTLAVIWNHNLLGA